MIVELDTIIGENIRLRPITKKDTSLIVKWRNNPAVRKNFIFQEKFTEKMHNQWLDSKVAKGEVIQYIIEEIEGEKPIGSVYLRDIDDNNLSAEYGIFIGEDQARGKGYGTETAILFIQYALEKVGFHRIFLRVLKENDAAYRSYLKAGFEKEGVFRDMVKVDGKYRDVIFMAIINEKDVE